MNKGQFHRFIIFNTGTEYERSGRHKLRKLDSYCTVLTTVLLNSKQKGTAGIGFLNPCFQIKMGSKSQEYKELFEKIDQEEDGEVYLR